MIQFKATKYIKRYINFPALDKWQGYCLAVFFICLGVHFCCALVGWNNNLYDMHSFRQTHTAITSYYTIAEGFKINYITPVLGASWSIPMEFPLYQWLVAALVLVGKTALDQTGRFVSLVFFYLSLIPLFGVLRIFVADKFKRLIILSVVLCTPAYIFWSRTFMIESTALFFSLAFLYFYYQVFEKNKPRDYILGVVFGCIAGLAKITTFCVFLFAAFCIYLWKFYQGKDYSIGRIKTFIIRGFILVGIPMLISAAWVKYADVQRMKNPLARHMLCSPAVNVWNFGTLKQRLTFSTWRQIMSHPRIIANTFGHIKIGHIKTYNFIWIMLFFLLFVKKRRLEICLLFLCFLIGPLVFTNLYYVHNYYFYANAIFLSVLLGLMIIALLDTDRTQQKIKTSVIVLPVLLIALFFNYWSGYYEVQKNGQENGEIAVSELIKKHTKPEDVILIYGLDWSSSIPYYAERKALMNAKYYPANHNRFKEAVESTGAGNITAMLVNGYDAYLSQNEDFVTNSLAALNFNSRSVKYLGKFRLYLRNQEKSRTLE